MAINSVTHLIQLMIVPVVMVTACALLINGMLPQLLRRHHLVHQALLTLYIAILGFIACMFLVVFAALLNLGLLATIALLLFLASTGVLLAGLIPVVREIHGSQQAICYEVQRVLSLGK